jgi:lipopolysaccharide export system permease protein
MPIIWRYLLRNYAEVLALCVSVFIAILLVTRFSDIASFASSGAQLSTIFLFTLYQIPHVLPIAIPVSCLIAAMILFQRLSHTHELTALRSCGLGLKQVTFPLILAGAVLSLLNFTIVSEIAPRCRTLTKDLAYQMTALNPLVLFQKNPMLKLKDAHIEMKTLRQGTCAEDVIFILKNLSHERLGLMVAKELSVTGNSLSGNQVTFISSLNAEGFDHLVIENQTSMATPSAHLTQFLKTAGYQSNYDYLPLRMILAKKIVDDKDFSFEVGRGGLEIARRLSISLAAFTFTLIGVAFGLEISRSRSKRGILWAIGWASFFMICFVAAKSFRHSPLTSCIVFLLPHPLILFFTLRALKQKEKGIE